MAASLRIGRRSLTMLGLAAAVPPARADTTDLAVTCDTTLAPALGKVGAAYTARTSVRVFVFPTGPGLILPQLQRDIQNDILVTQLPILERAAADGRIASATHGLHWRNQFVIAGLQRSSALDQSFAATDPTPASEIDGPAIVARLGLSPARFIGAVDTDEVVLLLTTGVAQAGLLHMTDVRADTRLSVIRPVPSDVQPSPVYSVAVTRLAQRPNPEGFLAFLTSPAAAMLLSESGLERET